ncbi:alpha/beta hydrolase fold domain-containing protein [Nocardia higoensis]|uniref:alpha/beta hydrolase fold domain-containing protein n=1 Tax=Nocardia higoensis TaxID=228599 RepID=UPI0003099E40|nr:alpha/beta hydrolase fold domain-containing protein [Nocardia higoensis]
MTTAERARDRMNGPKASPAPTARLRRRHLVTRSERGEFGVYTVTPRGRDPHCTVVYLHGGAYIGEITAHHWRFISRLADRGARVLVPIYGLAPQFSYRDAYPFVTRVYRDAADLPGPLTLMGDSSGGGLALGLAQTLRDLGAGVRQPDRLMLISPWLDLTIANPEVAGVDDPWLVREGLLEAGRAWAAGDDPTDPRLSPLNGELAGLPAIDIHAGTRDLAYPDCELLRERAVAAGVPARLTVVDGGLHVTPLLPVREGRTAAAEIAGEVCTLG